MQDRYALPPLSEQTWKEITAYQVQSMHEADTMIEDLNSQEQPGSAYSSSLWRLVEIHRRT